MANSVIDDNYIKSLLGKNIIGGTPLPVTARTTGGANPLDVYLAGGGETAGSSIGTGQQTVTTAGTAVQLASNACVSVAIKAKDTNTGVIYVGANGTSLSTTGFGLSAGDSVMYAAANTNLFYVDASVNGDGVYFTWVQV